MAIWHRVQLGGRGGIGLWKAFRPDRHRFSTTTHTPTRFFLCGPGLNAMHLQLLAKFAVVRWIYRRWPDGSGCPGSGESGKSGKSGASGAFSSSLFGSHLIGTLALRQINYGASPSAGKRHRWIVAIRKILSGHLIYVCIYGPIHLPFGKHLTQILIANEPFKMLADIMLANSFAFLRFFPCGHFYMPVFKNWHAIEIKTRKVDMVTDILKKINCRFTFFLDGLKKLNFCMIYYYMHSLYMNLFYLDSSKGSIGT